MSSPRFECDLQALEQNLKMLRRLSQESGIYTLHALKAFALPQTFALIRKYLSGASASSLHEARLAKKIGGEVHTYTPAFKSETFEEIANLSDKVIFNSLSQWERFSSTCNASMGLRLNLQLDVDIPEHCNPNRRYSRLGITHLERIPKEVEGLHVHALCSQNVEGFLNILHTLETRYDLSALQWLNLGGGHALTNNTYRHDRFIEQTQNFLKRHNHLKLYIEPGEAVVKNCGTLVATVLDIVRNEIDIAILDISVEVHLIDVMLTKQSPKVKGASQEGAYMYQLGGISCAAGDIISTYRFDVPLHVGDEIVFEDMMAYTLVKQTRFNGVEGAAVAVKN